MSSSFKMSGRFLGAGKVKEFEGKTTKVRNFWIDASESIQYPNTPEFSLLNDKVLAVEGIKIGDEVAVHFNIYGKKWEKDGKSGVGINLTAYKIEKYVKESTMAEVPDNLKAIAGQDDDLPF